MPRSPGASGPDCPTLHTVASVELDRVTVRKDGVEVLQNVDLVVEQGRVLGVVGASGSGKTSLLRAITGLDRVTAGAVRFDGVDVTHVEPARRDVALVFQQPTLYPKRSVGRNIAFPLEIRHDPVDQIRERVGAEARALHIEELLSKVPKELSAGEAQAVQIARAMVRAPAVLLLDESFAHLDLERAGRIRREISMIQRGFGVTTIVATNDAVDAMTLCDRLAVIEAGRITQTAEPLDVYRSPRTAAAALMTGDADVIEVRIVTDDLGAWIEHPGFRLRDWRPAMRARAGRRMQLVVRPEWWQLDANGPVDATVEHVVRLGTATSLWCRVGGHPLTVKLAGSEHGRRRPGDRITLRIDRFVLLDPVDGDAIEP
jgi:ABC-type sugar transport system ATPase subunit